MLPARCVRSAWPKAWVNMRTMVKAKGFERATRRGGMLNSCPTR
jgi:hypothetical protein